MIRYDEFLLNLPIYSFSQTDRGKHQGLCSQIYILNDHRIRVGIMARHLEGKFQSRVKSPHQTKT